MSNLSGNFSALAIAVALATLLSAMSFEYVPTTAFCCVCVVSAKQMASDSDLLNTVIMTIMTNSNVVKSSLRMNTLYFFGSLGIGFMAVCPCFCSCSCPMAYCMFFLCMFLHQYTNGVSSRLVTKNIA